MLFANNAPLQITVKIGEINRHVKRWKEGSVGDSDRRIKWIRHKLDNNKAAKPEDEWHMEREGSCRGTRSLSVFKVVSGE